MADKPNEREKQIVELARDTLTKEGSLEIDDDAKVSEGNDNGAYVQAWVWVSFANTPLNKEKSDET